MCAAQVAFDSGKFGSADTLHKPYAPQRMLFQVAVYAYWVLFIFIGECLGHQLGACCK